MNTEFFIAKRIISGSGENKKISKPIISIAIIGIALGLAVMILSVAIVTGFKNEIRNKVIGFGAHVQIVNYDSNLSYETKPIDKNSAFYKFKNAIIGINHIQTFATKAGIIKTQENIQGIVLKGIGSDFDWSFFNQNIVKGESFLVEDSVKSDKILISKSLASMLQLNVGDDVQMYFIQEPPRMRKFVVSGIYKTSLEEFDKLYAIVDISHIQKLNGWTENQVSGYEILVDEFSQIDEIAYNLYGLVANTFNSDGSMLTVTTVKEKNPQIFDWLELQNLNVWVILVLMTIVAGFNMVSGLLIIILERTSMIGVLKSFGTSNWSIRKIFLYNAAFLIGKGMFWGNLIGILICILQSYFGIIKLDPTTYYVDTVPINLNILHLVLLNLGTLFITFIMMILPSYIITRIKPIKAIQFN
ncbi:MAG TPA: ABC transporter permease [Bacteroidales bacterium]|nr:MAG: ABC transporter permease [Bacteroidetes bacterium GWF2_33_38]OFY91339.1 MAG: ABC transporter permease [Bacteroidetes bacterium RIFOXYA2_FULL_33_7]HBF88375.1 ABC transporter permease [Bacteroidales bacterium]